MLSRGKAVKGRFWWGKKWEGWGEGRAGAAAGHQCHQQPSVSWAQPAGLQRPPRVPEEGEGSPSPAPPELLARVGAALPPSSALLPMAEHADLSRRFPVFLPAAGCAGSWGEAAAPAPSAAPLPSAHPAPPHTDTSGCAGSLDTIRARELQHRDRQWAAGRVSPCVAVTAWSDGGS